MMSTLTQEHVLQAHADPVYIAAVSHLSARAMAWVAERQSDPRPWTDAERALEDAVFVAMRYLDRLTRAS
jgi:hypothetical protein